MDFGSNPAAPAVGAVIPGKAPASSMSYHKDGKRLYVASEQDARLTIIDCLAGKAVDAPSAYVKLEREQIHLVEASHHEHCVLFAGKGSSANGTTSQQQQQQQQPSGLRNAVNYLSLHDNKILRKFRGHTDIVTSIHMSPADDTFLSASADRTVRLWNIQAAGCLAECKLPPAETTGLPLAVFDSTGLVFAVTAAIPPATTATAAQSAGHYVHLYDARNYNAGAFSEFKITQPDLQKAIHASQSNVALADRLSKGDWHSIAFNESGNQILIGADAGLSILLDGYEGTIQRTFVTTTTTTTTEAAAAEKSRRAVSCFSSDDKTILAASGREGDGTITCWSVETGNAIKKLVGHNSAVNCLASNPVYQQIASSCKDTALWIWPE